MSNTENTENANNTENGTLEEDFRKLETILKEMDSGNLKPF